jgi:hypothetical protein
MNTKTKRVNGTDLNAKCFLWAPDPENTDCWLLPVFDPTSAAKTQNHLRNHIARFTEMKSIPPAERSKLWERLVGACIGNGVTIVGNADVVPAAAAAPPPVTVKTKPIKKDAMVEAIVAEADRRCNELLRSLGLE